MDTHALHLDDLAVAPSYSLSPLNIYRGPEGWAKLSGRELLLLRTLVRAGTGRVVERRQIMDAFWNGLPDGPCDKVVDVTLCRLRKKMAEAGKGCRIVTQSKVGFALVGGEASEPRTVHRSFTPDQWRAVLDCVATAEQHIPGIRALTGIEA